MAGPCDCGAFADWWEDNARLALDTVAFRPTKGIPTWAFQTMQWSQLEALSGNPPGSYAKEPVRVYLEFMQECGVCFLDQWIPENPLSMTDQGYDDDAPRGATRGAEEIICDGMRIDSPEAARTSAAPVIRFSDEVGRAVLVLKRFLSENFYNHPRVLRMTRKAEWIVGDLYRVYHDDPMLLPARVRERFHTESPTRVTADHLAGMTDRFAMTEHRKLLDPHAPA